jgi:hypothetical protein
MQRVWGLCLLAILSSSLVCGAYALPPGTEAANETTSFVVSTALGPLQCAFSLKDFVWKGGHFVGTDMFLSYQQEAKNLKKSAVKATTAAKEAKLLKKSKTTKKKAKLTNSLCTESFNNKDSNFDDFGNLTETGKVNFGIPNGLSGNISDGKAIFDSYCTCHEAKLNHNFDFYRTNISKSPMLYTVEEISDAMLANLTAYLNRFQVW